MVSEMSESVGRRPISKYGRCVVSLMLIQGMLIGWRAYTESFVWDEVGHLASGIHHLETGRFDLYRVNPPLVRTVAASGPFIAGYQPAWENYSPDPRSRSEFAVGEDFIINNGERSFWLLTIARWCVLWIPLLGAWVCHRWALQLYGQGAGIVALMLWVFSPTVLANGSLITADCGAATFGILTGYALWRWQKQPGCKRALSVGLAAGLALLTKSTWVILFGLLPLIVVAWLLVKLRIISIVDSAKPQNTNLHHVNCAESFPTNRKRPGSLYWKGMLVILLTALFILNYGYGFEGSFQRLGNYSFISNALSTKKLPPDPIWSPESDRRNVFSESWAGSIPVPVPENFLLGMDVQRFDFEHCPRSYLRGQWREKGWWYYYLYCFVIKEPLGLWGLFILAFVLPAVYYRRWLLSLGEVNLWIPIMAIVIVVSSQTGMSHHFRYIMPALPFLFVWIARVGIFLEQGPKAIQVLIVLLLAWGSVSSLSVFPHSITYFNELVGGPRNGHLHLNNSNLDWGQGLLHLRNWQQAHPEAQPFFLRHRLPLLDPKIADIDYGEVPTRQQLEQRAGSGHPDQVELQPGWYAISVSSLISHKGSFDYFKMLEPVDRVANVFWIFKISEAEAAELERTLASDSR